MAEALKTRFAPTPSGYLHLGNAWSFVITWLAARSVGGSIHLRIDDLDAARSRDEYLEDIFATLDWLGLDYDSGPRDPADFSAHHSQRLRLDAYREALDKLMAAETLDGPLVYACSCSREQAKRAAALAGNPSLYPGTCRSLGLDRANPDHLLRLRVGRNHPVGVKDVVSGNLALEPADDMGDFVLRLRNGDPSYQLTSVIDDEALGINYVVRGLDLLPSSGAQVLLARLLGLEGFQRASFLHHGLMLQGKSAKLSKSAGDTSIASLRARLRGPAPLYRYFAARLGMEPAGKYRAVSLLEGFSPQRVPSTPLAWEDFLLSLDK
jgi:glutamyl/glutaminyl-tRNA synthetase